MVNSGSVVRSGSVLTAASGVSFLRAVSQALHAAPPMPIDATLIDGCLDPEHRPLDVVFQTAWRRGLYSLPRSARSGQLSGVTGHVGESVVEALFDALGYHMLWHFPGPLSGGHGADLIVLSPDDKVIVVEVKATLRPGRWPRPSQREIVQLDEAWLDKEDNPGMANWDLRSEDVCAAVVVVNLAQCLWRCVITADFHTVRPISEPSALASLAWLDEPERRTR